ncbi:MAG: hypothetical protein JW951_01035, partial [Lentisphaerae bacterium]|nr:hypothetical protein [Lentisphaerota bacterium]
LLAAVGVTCGTLFSFPVAAFVAASLLVMAVTARYVSFAPAPGRGGEPAAEAPAGAEGGAAWIDRAGESLLRGARGLAGPALSFHPLARLAEGLLVSWREGGRAAFWLLLVYPAGCAALGSAVLSRRELAG